MAARYELWLDQPDGTRIALIDAFESLEYALVINRVGALTLTLGDVDETLYQADRRIEVWRAPEPLDEDDHPTLVLQRVYLLSGVSDYSDAAGARRLIVTGLDGNSLLTGRIVAYAAGSSQASKTAATDDLMKAVIRENLGASATDADRDWTSEGLTVQADLGAGPSLTRSFSRRNVLDVLQDLADAARQAGTETYFDVISPTPSTFEFRTRTGQPGRDHTYPDGDNPVLLGVEFGNLAEPRLDQDWSEEATVVYAGGQGEGADREIVEVEDTARSGRSIWGRREAFADGRNESATAGVTAAGNAMLAARRPRRRFSGRIVDAPGTRYGVAWAWGDRISAVYRGQQYDALIRAVQVRIDENGLETIDARLETDE